MALRRAGLAALLALWSARLLAQAAPSAAAGSGGAIERSRAIVELGMFRTLAPGAQIAVSRAGRIVWSESFGCADVELDVPVASDTRLRIGSVSKPLTAAALGLLVEEGRLDLDRPVQAYVPDFPRKAWPITTRQLAGHLAGIRHYEAGEFDIRDHYDTVRAGLAIFEKDALIFEPGTKFSYSSYGWNLISAVIEGASGEPFLAFMQKRVFAPAGMTHTAADDPTPIVPGRARFYTRDDSTGAVRNAAYVDNSYKWAGGGFLSTAEDLVAFGNALLEGRLLEARDPRPPVDVAEDEGRQGHRVRHRVDGRPRREGPAPGAAFRRRDGRDRQPRDLSGRASRGRPARQQRRVLHGPGAGHRGGVSR